MKHFDLLLRYRAAFIAWIVITLFAIPVSAGGLGPIYTENFDGVRSPALPSGWVASQGVNVTGAPLWVTSIVTPDTAPNDAFSTAPNNVLDNRLDTPMLPIGGQTNAIRFVHSYNLESGLDGAVLEISSPNINGGAFTDVTDPAAGGQFAGAGYNATISTNFQSPIAGRMAWTGNSGGYIFTHLIFGLNPPQRGDCGFAWLQTTTALPRAGESIHFPSMLLRAPRRRRRLRLRPHRPQRRSLRRAATRT